MDELLQELSLLVRARYPIIYLVSWEERRIEKALRGLAKDLQKRVYFWRSSRGFVPASGDAGMSLARAFMTPDQ